MRNKNWLLIPPLPDKSKHFVLMNFLNPFFLLGLLAVAIPVLIHLVNLRRPKKVPFSTLAFLEELKKSTIKRIRIKQYLLMALRALAILMLALALARPFLPPTLTGSSSSNEPKAIAIIIDNSASMSRIGSQGPLIDQAKDVATTIINNARAEDRFIVATTNGASEALSFTGATRALELSGQVESNQTGNFISQKLQLVYNQLQQAPQKQAIVYLISDMQESQLQELSSFQSETAQENKPVVFQMVGLGDINQQNLAITNVQLESQMLSKGSPVTLSVEVKNTGDVAAGNQFVSLEIGDRMLGQYQTELEPGQSQEFVFEINPSSTGDIIGRAILEGDEIVYDNTRYFVIRIPESRSVLLLNQQEQSSSEFVSYLKPALDAARQTNTQITFDEQTVEEANQSNWSNYDVVIFDGIREIPEYWFADLQRYVQNGNGLMLFPSEQGNISNYNSFLNLFNAGSFTNVNGEYASFKPSGSLAGLVEGHPILDELFDKEEEDQISLNLPELFFYYTFEEPNNTGSYQILESENGSSVLAEQRFGDGKVLISSIGMDPGWSNFPVNPLFAPLYYRSVLYAASTEQGGIEEHILGNRFEWEGALSSQEIQLTIGENNIRPEVQTTADGVRLSYEAREWTPGVLKIMADEVQRNVAVNQSIMESEFATLESGALDNLIEGNFAMNEVIEAANLSNEELQSQLKTASFGKEIWNWLIWIALVLLVAETLITRLYKAETIS